MADTIIGAHDGTFKTDGSISMRETQEFLARREGLSTASFHAQGLEGSVSLQKLYDASNPGGIVLAGNSAYPSNNYSLGGLRGASYQNNTPPVISLLGPSVFFVNNTENISDLPEQYVNNILSYNPNANFDNFEYDDDKYWYGIYWQGWAVNGVYRFPAAAYTISIVNKDLGGTNQVLGYPFPYGGSSSDLVLHRINDQTYSSSTNFPSYRSAVNNYTTHTSIDRANFVAGDMLEVNAIGYKNSNGIVDRGLTDNHRNILNQLTVVNTTNIWGYHSYYYGNTHSALYASVFIFPIKSNT
tara:strand:+ start:431 stop:1327 length:897 start_codon:yes stop_codon:yes gene_type:complete